MSRRREVRIQSALLMILLPVLFLTTAGFGYLLYSQLYREILVGFDARLRAVGTITGAFIDGDRHAELLRGYRPAALAVAPGHGALFAVDSENRLLRLDPETGCASPAGCVGIRFADLAWDAGNGRLIGLEAETGVLHVIDAMTGTTRRLAETGEGQAGLAWESSTGKLYVAGAALTQIDPVDFSSRRIRSFEGFRLRALSQGHSPGTLVGLTDASPPEMVQLRLPEGSAGTGIRLLDVGAEVAPGSAEGNQTQGAAAAVSARGLAWDSRNGVLWTLGESLGRIDWKDGRLEFFGYPGFRNENTPAYQSYIGPMRRIKEGVGLTYLYTFVLGEDGRQIVYVLDANLDEDHSRIGDIDADPAEPATIRVLREGGVNLSEIEYWEQWGLLKSADAPIFRGDGTVVALAGADINVSIINEKTRSALAKVLLTGLLCVLIASVAVVKVSNSLLKPIEELKNQALKVAAGEFGQQVRVDRPAELRELAEGFNEMSAALKETVEGLSASNSAMERERQRAELVLTIAKRTDRPLPEVHSSVLCGRSGLRPIRRDASGWLAAGKFLYCWYIDDNPEDPFEAVRLRSDLWSLVKSLSEKKQNDWAEIREFLAPLFHGVVGSFLQLDMESLRLRGMVRSGLRVGVLSATGVVRATELDGFIDFQPDPGEQFLILGPRFGEILQAFEDSPPRRRLRSLQAIRDELAERNGEEPLSRTDNLILAVWRDQ